MTAPLSTEQASALAERRGRLEHLKNLEFPCVQESAEAEQWLQALTESVNLGESLALRLLTQGDRCRALFLEGLPGAVCFEWLQRSEGPGVGAVVIAERGEAGPVDLLWAFFGLAGHWCRTASQGWIGAGAPRSVDMEAAWGDLRGLILGGDRRAYHSRPVAPDRFVEALDQSLSVLRTGRDLRVLRDNVIPLPNPLGFQPLDEPVRSALALLDEWNEKTFVAATASRYLLLMWWTSA